LPAAFRGAALQPGPLAINVVGHPLARFDLKREASTTGHDDRVADLPGASAAPFSRRVEDEVR
jgi:hypothetical protein